MTGVCSLGHRSDHGFSWNLDSVSLLTMSNIDGLTFLWCLLSRQLLAIAEATASLNAPQAPWSSGSKRFRQYAFSFVNLVQVSGTLNRSILLGARIQLSTPFAKSSSTIPLLQLPHQPTAHPMLSGILKGEEDFASAKSSRGTQRLETRDLNHACLQACPGTGERPPIRPSEYKSRQVRLAAQPKQCGATNPSIIPSKDLTGTPLEPPPELLLKRNQTAAPFLTTSNSDALATPQHTSMSAEAPAELGRDGKLWEKKRLKIPCFGSLTTVKPTGIHNVLSALTAPVAIHILSKSRPTKKAASTPSSHTGQTWRGYTGKLAKLIEDWVSISIARQSPFALNSNSKLDIASHGRHEFDT
ncbi:hypothetical protein BKA70DRAFT_1242522 [Coprinopsis sp. MPI-PUGE-AT-0042]|nr:hypothetical protein BKA70DRAFT_1242522 [Coprinopsis sp. MPI-PUGE-AT-0042]